MEICVVLPFCTKDVLMMQKNLAWQDELGTKWPECLLSYENTVSKDWVGKIEQAARRCYQKVTLNQYPPAKPGYWPPNQAFQQAAKRMAIQSRPWLWFESDCVPLCKDWLKTMNEEYFKAGKPFFGPIVSELLHANGTCVYPANAASIIKSAMNEGHTAWDVAMKSEMIEQCADASHLLCHCWTFVDGRLNQFGGGPEPFFGSREDLRLIPPTAVIFHRDKRLSLVDRLRECKKEMK